MHEWANMLLMKKQCLINVLNSYATSYIIFLIFNIPKQDFFYIIIFYFILLFKKQCHHSLYEQSEQLLHLGLKEAHGTVKKAIYAGLRACKNSLM